MLSNKELREMDDAKLTETLKDTRHELFSMRFKHATAQLEKHPRLSAAPKRPSPVS